MFNLSDMSACSSEVLQDKLDNSITSEAISRPHKGLWSDRRTCEFNSLSYKHVLKRLPAFRWQ